MGFIIYFSMFLSGIFLARTVGAWAACLIKKILLARRVKYLCELVVLLVGFMIVVWTPIPFTDNDVSLNSYFKHIRNPSVTCSVQVFSNIKTPLLTPKMTILLKIVSIYLLLLVLLIYIVLSFRKLIEVCNNLMRESRYLHSADSDLLKVIEESFKVDTKVSN